MHFSVLLFQTNIIFNVNRWLCLCISSSIYKHLQLFIIKLLIHLMNLPPDCELNVWTLSGRSQQRIIYNSIFKYLIMKVPRKHSQNRLILTVMYVLLKVVHYSLRFIVIGKPTQVSYLVTWLYRLPSPHTIKPFKHSYSS